MKRLLYVFFIFVFISSCDDYDVFSSSPNSLLAFSSDDLSFDTVMTHKQSATKTIVVFNNNKKGIRISRIFLTQGENSPFKVNADGFFLVNGSADEFEIHKSDSMMIRVEAKLPEEDTDEITHFEDNLNFELESGVIQSVKLEAFGLNVMILGDSIIDHDMTLDSKRPYLFNENLTVSVGCTLTLSPGTTLMFHDNASLNIHGTLLANGTTEKPITFRCDRVDRIFPYLPYDNMPNRWGGIHIYKESRGNIFNQCDIHGSDYGIIVDDTEEQDPQQYSLKVENSIIHNIGGPGVILNNCMSEFLGTQISNTKNDCLYINGGYSDFIHCTVAQFYPWKVTDGNAVYITNKIDDNTFCNIYRCNFTNCLITGYADDVLGGQVYDSDGILANYYFLNCLLKTDENSNDRDKFEYIIYDNDSEVKSEGHFIYLDTDNFLYDFRLKEVSTARNTGNIEAAEKCQFDRYGINRLADNMPDLGAYEYNGEQPK